MTEEVKHKDGAAIDKGIWGAKDRVLPNALQAQGLNSEGSM